MARKEVVRSIDDHHDPDLALEFVGRLGSDLKDDSCPPEVRQLGRTITRWRYQIAAWHHAQVSNGPTEALNNLIKRIKRIAFGFRRFAHDRIRALLYAGKPNWDRLARVTPAEVRSAVSRTSRPRNQATSPHRITRPESS